MRQIDVYDLGLVTERDITTDPLYVFTSYTLSPNALTTDAAWICTRTTVSNGSVRFAQGINGKAITSFDNPEKRLLKASLAATYTY